MDNRTDITFLRIFITKEKLLKLEVKDYPEVFSTFGNYLSLVSMPEALNDFSEQFIKFIDLPIKIWGQF